ncbi:MAG: helix-turn-helix transcriptional regulator [Clostridia bacterium]|nr:helix-turn-helix transcriptional regulator [Clostridia bacterium]
MIRLKELRQERGLNQQQLALEIKTTQRNISNWENGNSEPDIQMILKMAKYFEVTADYLLDNDEELSRKENLAIIDNALITAVKNLPIEKKRALLILLQGYYL